MGLLVLLVAIVLLMYSAARRESYYNNWAPFDPSLKWERLWSKRHGDVYFNKASGMYGFMSMKKMVQGHIIFTDIIDEPEHSTAQAVS